MLATLASSAIVLAQDEVFFTQTNNQILRADFDNGLAVPVINHKGSNFNGLAVREDGLLVVANSTKGGNVMACDPSAGSCQEIIDLDKAAGVALSNLGDLFAVNSRNNKGHKIVAVERAFGCGVADCLPGGYDPDGVTIRNIDVVDGWPIKQLVDVKVARFSQGNVVLGAVLVLAQQPPLIFSLPQDLTGDPTIVVDPSELAGLTPNGFDFSAEGKILVTTKQGVIAQFDVNGNRIADYAALPGQGVNVAGGLEINSAPAARVYATAHKQVLRFDENGNLSGVVTGVKPYGVATPSTGAFAWTPAGSQAQVSTSSLLTTWQQINVGGYTSAFCTDFVDPREDPFVDSDLVVCVKPDGELQVDLEDFPCVPGTKRIIPSYMRGWRRVAPGDDIDDPEFPRREEPPAPPGPTGPFTLRLCQVDFSESGGFSGLIIDESVEETWLGYDPGHPGMESDSLLLRRSIEDDPPVCLGGPRSFYASSDGDPELLEHPFFTDASISCGLNLTGSWQRSFLLPTVRDLREIDTDGTVADAVAFDGESEDTLPGFCDPAAGALDCKLAVLLTLANVDLEDTETPFECGDGGLCCVSDVELRDELATHLVDARQAVDRARDFDPPCAEDYESARSALSDFIGAIEGAPEAFDECESQLEAQFRARALSANFLLTTLLDEAVLTEECLD
jgi:hypothetical protein